jgi:hypothetical protein
MGKSLGGISASVLGRGVRQPRRLAPHPHTTTRLRSLRRNTAAHPWHLPPTPLGTPYRLVSRPQTHDARRVPQFAEVSDWSSCAEWDSQRWNPPASEARLQFAEAESTGERRTYRYSPGNSLSA